MAEKKETKFWTDVVKPALESLPHVYARKTQELAKHGILDVEICIVGHWVVLELKKDLQTELAAWTAELLQANNVRKIRRAGGYARFVSPQTWPEVWEALKTAAQFGLFYSHVLNQGGEE